MRIPTPAPAPAPLLTEERARVRVTAALRVCVRMRSIDHKIMQQNNALKVTFAIRRTLFEAKLLESFF